MFTIYCHTHIDSGRKYVGQTCRSLEDRWGSHVRSVGTDACRDLPFARAIAKYGPNSFTHETLEVVDTQHQANKAEAYWIAQLNTRSPHGFNLDAGGRVEARKHPDTIQKMSEARRRVWANKTPSERTEIAMKRVRAMTPERRLEISRIGNASQKETASARMRAWQAARSPEERRAVAKKASEAAKIVNSKKTFEEYSVAAKKANAARTPEQRSSIVKKQWAGTTPEERSKRMRAMHALMTPEQQHQRLLKAWETRRLKKAAIIGCDIGCGLDTKVRG